MNQNTVPADPSNIRTSWRGSLPGLVAELERQKATKFDFVADTRTVAVEPPPANGPLLLTARDVQTREFLVQPQVMSDRAITQIGERVEPKIPGRFARDLATTHPAIAANLINQMLTADPSRCLFRCLDGRVRAVLSSKYRIFDDLDIAFGALQVIKDNNGTVLECTASDSRFEIKFTALHMVEHIQEERSGGQGAEKHLRRTTLDPNQFKHLGVGAVTPFVKVWHSSVGEGGLGISFGLLRLACLNGAIAEQAMNQVHLGSAQEVGRYTEETVSADSKAIMLKARDLIAGSLNPANFARIVGIAKKAASDTIAAPSMAVNNLVENASLTESAKEAILAHFLRDYDSNRYGLSQAISRAAQDLDDPESASNLESLAGRVLTTADLITV